MAEEINAGGAPGALPATIEEALPVIAKLQEDNAGLSGQLNDAKVIIGELKAEIKGLKEQKVAEVKIPVVEIDGVKYKVVHGVHGIGDAKALSQDLDACKKIIAKGGAALVKI